MKSNKISFTRKDAIKKIILSRKFNYFIRMRRDKVICNIQEFNKSSIVSQTIKMWEEELVFSSTDDLVSIMRKEIYPDELVDIIVVPSIYHIGDKTLFYKDNINIYCPTPVDRDLPF